MTERYLGSIISPSPVEPTGSFADQTASGVWNIHDPLLFGQASDWPVTGNVNPGKFIENLFNVTSYVGTGSSGLRINNGIDLSGEGGLLWLKNRENTFGLSHGLYDTLNGVDKRISSDSDNQMFTSPSGEGPQSFNSDGFTLGNNLIGENVNAQNIMALTFRKAPKFFDIVTYTGNGSSQNISHNLGSVPGCIIIKRTSSTEEWNVYHRGYTDGGNPTFGKLNSTDAFSANTSVFNNTFPTSSVFTVDSNNIVNASSETYVAYLFAHNDGDGGFGANGDQDIIKCGSFTTDSSGSALVGPDLGFEPQWVLLKNATSTQSGNWWMVDIVRGFSSQGFDSDTGKTSYLVADGTGVEGEFSNTTLNITPTGFTMQSDGFSPGQTFVYIAIRRGPMQTPTAGTEIFDVTETGNDSNLFTTDLSIIDVNWQKQTNGSNYWFAQHRLTGERPYMKLNATDALTAYGSDRGMWDQFTATSDPQKAKVKAYTSNSNVIYSFKRAPKVFDVITYTGTGSEQTLKHNLGAVPELIIRKKLNSADAWEVASDITSTNYNLSYLNSGGAATSVPLSSTGVVMGTPSSTQFNALASSDKFLNYLFATLEGVSKVGSYSGTGSDVNVDCGFSNGSFLVIVKRTDSSGDWYVWDSNRNIVAGNDPYNIINSTAAAVDSTDYIDPLSSGFTITSNAGSDLNASGGTYTFLAIAK